MMNFSCFLIITNFFFQNLAACCSQSGDGFTLFGEPGGAIFKLSRKMQEYCWIAHKRSLTSIALAGNVLATVGVGVCLARSVKFCTLRICHSNLSFLQVFTPL